MVVAMLAAVLLFMAWPAGGVVTYIQDDVRIAAGEVYTFNDGNEMVTIAVGNFNLQVGTRRLSGRDAVIWIRTSQSGGVTRQDMQVYAEGGAKVVESSGATTTDSMMLVEVHAQGRIVLRGRVMEKSLQDLPLYARAREQRMQLAQTRASSPQPARHEPPELIVAVRPPPPPPPPVRKYPPADPNLAGQIVQRRLSEIQPVTFYAESFTAQRQENQRVFIARGNVYLSQGDAKSDLFLELRSQSAVVFTQKRAPVEKESRTPLSPKIGGMGGGSQEPNETRETVVGVYLEGDVVISRGERFMRGPAAYYDFTTDRAIVVDTVFRTRQQQRNIPVYVRAKEGRMLSAREMWFRDAQVSTSDFYTPSYSVNADIAYMMDKSAYDDEGVRISQQEWYAKTSNTTFDIAGIPVFWTPFNEGDVTQSPIPLRTIQFGKDPELGWGAETQWYLFRVLGLVAPEGFKGTLEVDPYQHGAILGAKLRYARQSFSGYDQIYGILDERHKDSLGREMRDVDAPRERGRLTARHKQEIDDWELQFELSYISDKNFLQRFFPEEYYSGKEQETLLYAKKQRDNWAFTALLKYRLNRFQTQDESYPEAAFYLLGEPLANDNLNFFSESRAGVKRFRQANGDSNAESSDVMVRGDTRNEIDFPLHLGPVNLVHYATGRATGWTDAPPGGSNARPYGQVGIKGSTDMYRQDESVYSRLWNVNGLRHIVSPYADGFLSSTGGVEPDDLFPMEPDIEQHLMRMNAWSAGVNQRLQTRRGNVADQRTENWMRFNVAVGQFDTDNKDLLPADGRFYESRPEYSLARNFVNGEYFWAISDATSFLTDTNFDTDKGDFRRTNFGLIVRRDPRVAYYLGLRMIDDYQSSVGVVGLNYEINRKYRMSIFEQYDFRYDDGRNLATNFTIVRKLDRWYAAVTLSYDQVNDEVLGYISLWPEGVPEVRLGSNHMNLLTSSNQN